MLTPQFSHYKNAEAVQFHDNVLSILNKYDSIALNIAPQVGVLDGKFETLEKLFIIDQGNAITKEIQDLDSRRDDCLIGIGLNVDSYKKHFDEEKRAASEVISKVLDKHGRDLYRRSYPEETAGIRSLVDEAETKPQVTQAVALLGLTEWVGELKTTNNLFDEKYLERNEAYAEAPKEKFADVRIETEEAYEKMMTHLSAHAVINPSETYEKVLGEIEQLVASYNQTVKNRIANGSINKPTE